MTNCDLNGFDTLRGPSSSSSGKCVMPHRLGRPRFPKLYPPPPPLLILIFSLLLPLLLLPYNFLILIFLFNTF